jgi:hypothetical protein
MVLPGNRVIFKSLCVIIPLAALLVSCAIVTTTPELDTGLLVSETRSKAYDLGMPLVDEFIADGSADIIGQVEVDLGNGIVREIPQLGFVDATTENLFDGRIDEFLQEALGDDYQYLHEEVDLGGSTRGISREGNYVYDERLHDIRRVKIKIYRRWSWFSYYLQMNVSGWQADFESLYCYLEDEHGSKNGGSTGYPGSGDIHIVVVKTPAKHWGDRDLALKSYKVKFTDTKKIPGNWVQYSNHGTTNGYDESPYFLSSMKSLRYRDWSWKTNYDFPRWWDLVDGFESNDMEHLAVSEVWNPPASQVRNIVFLVAGQQKHRLNVEGRRNSVTGQYQGWHANPDTGVSNGTWKRMTSRTTYIRKQSMAGLVMDDYYEKINNLPFNPNDTYLVLVHDACLWFDMNEDKKKRAVNAWNRWLLNKVGEENLVNVKNIYLGGASRGGALVTRMAYRLRYGDPGIDNTTSDDDYSESTWWQHVKYAQITVGVFDGVANYQMGGELFTHWFDKTDNPLTGDPMYWTRTSYLGTMNDYNSGSYLNESNIDILQVAGGYQLEDGFAPDDIRSFFLDWSDPSDSVHTEFVVLNHPQICQDYSQEVMDYHFEWLIDHVQWGTADTVDPEIELTSPAAGRDAMRSFVVVGSANDVHSGILSVTVNVANLDTSDDSEETFYENEFIIPFSNMDEGQYLVTVTAEDNSGNTSTLQRYFTVSGALIPAGLVFWTTFDTSLDIAYPTVGPGGTMHGNDTFVPGRYGTGYQAGPDDDNMVTFPSDIIPYEAGCVEFWAKIEGYTDSTTVGSGHRPQFFGCSTPGKSYRMVFAANDGWGAGGLTARAANGNCGTNDYNVSNTYGNILGDAEAWHHYALVWDKDGVGSTGFHLQMYVDGAAVSSPNIYGQDHDATVFEPHEPEAIVNILEQWGSTAVTTIDNFKVWNYSKTDFSDRFVE